jgi:signal transduction histidine kinase
VVVVESWPGADAVSRLAEAPPPSRPLRGGLLYGIAFLLYFVVEITVFRTGGFSWQDAAVFAVANTFPPAALGLGVVAIYRRDGARRRGLASLLRHAGLGLAYATAVTLLSNLIVLAGVGPRFQWKLETTFWMMILATLIFGILATAAHALRVEASLDRERARAAEAEALRSRAELAALRARLNPHFLFNTLHSLLALVRVNPRQAEEAMERFGDLLRYSLEVSDGGEERSLRQEWELVETYLELEKLRLGERLRIRARLDPAAADARVPALTLQPLVENAVRHAIAPRAGGGTIELRGTLDNGEVVVRVADDGPGASPEALAAGTGLGLRLVRERLERLYEREARMELARTEGGGLSVTLRIPREID